MDFKRAIDAVVIYCDSAKALQKLSVATKEFEDLSKLVDEYRVKRPTASGKAFEAPVVARSQDTAMNEMVTKFDAMVLKQLLPAFQLRSLSQGCLH